MSVQKEVHGMPWHKFIHPDYLERTKSILSQRSQRDSSITFQQVYKHKDGSAFSTVDSHTIFFSNGQPVSDLVFISLDHTSARLPSPSSQPHSYSYPLLTESATNMEVPLAEEASFVDTYSSPPTTPPPTPADLEWTPETLEQSRQFQYQLSDGDSVPAAEELSQFWDFDSILQNNPSVIDVENLSAPAAL